MERKDNSEMFLEMKNIISRIFPEELITLLNECAKYHYGEKEDFCVLFEESEAKPMIAQVMSEFCGGKKGCCDFEKRYLLKQLFSELADLM